ncbi:hypothetical protein Trydic_g6665 [Trypoxylus dichotomus]
MNETTPRVKNCCLTEQKPKIRYRTSLPPYNLLQRLSNGNTSPRVSRHYGGVLRHADDDDPAGHSFANASAGKERKCNQSPTAPSNRLQQQRGPTEPYVTRDRSDICSKGDVINGVSLYFLFMSGEIGWMELSGGGWRERELDDDAAVRRGFSNRGEIRIVLSIIHGGRRLKGDEAPRILPYHTHALCRKRKKVGSN